MAQRPDIKIECRNVSKSFVTEQYTINVLDDISLQVEENEFLVVLGPGQSGKTTLLNCMAGIIMPDAGQILLDGKTVAGPGPDRGVVFQQYALFPWKTVMDNVSFGLYIKGVEKSKRNEVAQKYIDLVGLQGFEKSFPHQLSGGMKQRVGLARAWANGPYLGDRVIVLSCMPGRIKSQYPIDIPKPREYTDPRFLEMRRKISDDTELSL